MSQSTARVLPRLLVAICAGALAGPLAIATSTGVAVAAERAGSSYGQIVTVAGIGEKGYSGDGQRATDARIDQLGTIDVGPDGTLYIVDAAARRIRAVNGEGVIDTVPGTRALRSPENDGPEVKGWQYSPSDRPQAVAAGKDGTLYVAGRETIRRLGRDGSSTMIAKVDAEPIGRADDIAVDVSGNVYVSSDRRIHKIDPTGKVTTIGGGGNLDPPGADGKPATEARLGEYTLSIAVDSRGCVYLIAPPDSSSGHKQSTLHKIDPDGTLRTVAGGGEPGFSGDGGPAAKAQLGELRGGVAVDAKDNVYLHDTGNGVVRVIGTDGVITSIAPPVPAGTAYGGDLAVGPHGDVYVKRGARVHMLVRNGNKPAAQPAREPTYPSRFPHDDPGAVRTVAGSGRTERPAVTPGTYPAENRRLRIADGPDGSRYYSDSARHRVMKVAADGTSSVLAGTGEKGSGGDGGDAARAYLNTPTGVDVGQDGSVYIADSGNNRVRKVDPTGVITSVAADGGPATAASVTPVDVAVGADGILYIAEGKNSRISRVAPDGTISTFAGTGKRWMEKADGHPATEASLFRPSAVAVGRDGAVYLLDDGVEGVRPAVRMIDTNGIIRTVAGDSYRDEGEAGFGGDGGPAAKAELNNPHDIATGPDGTLYIADTYNARIRAVDAKGTITTVAGNGQRADSGDGAPAKNAAVNEPQAVDVGANGTIHTINLPGDRIRGIDHGTITTVGTITKPDDTNAAIAGNAGKPATEAAIDPRGVAIDHDGTLLVTDLVGGLYAVEANGTLKRPFADKPEFARLDAVAVGPDGSRYVAAGAIVYRVAADGAQVLIAGGGPNRGGQGRIEPGQPATMASFRNVVDLAVSSNGWLYIATSDGVYRLADDGTLAAAFNSDSDKSNQDIRVSGIAVDAEERLYTAVSGADRVYRVDATGGKRSTVAGNGSSTIRDDDNGDGGDATEAALDGPSDVAVDNSGNIYIGTFGGIRRVDADGTIITVADNPWVDGGRGQIGALALDRHGDLYYADHTHNQVKVLVQPGKITEPTNWGMVIWITVGVLALIIVGWFGLRRWRRRTPQELAVDNEQTTDEATEPATSTEE